MSLNYRFEEDTDGDHRLGMGSYAVPVSVEVTPEEGNVHAPKVVNTQYGEKVRLTGDTYNAKDAIKRPEWDDVHHEWTGDFWRVDVGGFDIVAGSIIEAGYTVSADRSVIEQASGFEDMRDTVRTGPNERHIFEHNFGDEEGTVSRTWAERAARTAHYESAEEFAEDFGLTVIDDEKAMERAGVSPEDEKVELVTSEGGQ